MNLHILKNATPRCLRALQFCVVRRPAFSLKA